MYQTLLLLFFAILCLFLPVTTASSPPNCVSKVCGNLTISYPFWLDESQQWQSPCAGVPSFLVNCSDGVHAFLENSRRGLYRILNIFYGNNSFLLVDERKLGDVAGNPCHVPHGNVSTNLGLAPFVISPANLDLFLYNCSVAPPPPRPELVPMNCSNHSFARLGGHHGPSNDNEEFVEGCNATIVPVLGFAGAKASDYVQLIREGFLLNWASDDCAHGRHGSGCDAKHNRMLILKVLLPTASTLLFTCLIFILMYRRNKQKLSLFFLRKNPDTKTNFEELLEKYGSLAPKRYKYSELKKITRCFKDKLGEGGYGMVFKGILQDGCMVAVKLLHGSKGNGDEFLNEVISISRTSHVNIVSLLGFCLTGSKRALIYEYMSNGSLEKYVYSENPKMTIGWAMLQEIAVGIARGLEYLHQGCNTRIVHFDIKPQNILLDHDFCPKIADFGLAKLCHLKDSVLSMAEARGTIGFIAPEVFSRSFGVVSTKSDVYSYGMMLLEMIRGRNSVKANAEKSSEVHFPHWIYDHLEKGLQACEVTSETEEIARKMILVGLWCIQTIPGNRPSMSRVLEMLQRNINELEMPPKPYLCSPMR